MVNDIVNYINIGLAVVGCISTIISLIVAYVKSVRNGNSMKFISLIEKIPLFVTTAENVFGSGNGAMKLEYVLTQLKMLAIQNGLIVDEEKLRNEVNNVVLATNYVNVGGSKTNTTKHDLQDESNIEQSNQNDNTICKDDSNSIVDNKIFGE